MCALIIGRSKNVYSYGFPWFLNIAEVDKSPCAVRNAYDSHATTAADHERMGGREAYPPHISPPTAICCRNVVMCRYIVKLVDYLY